ncbi:MAG TPA: hypothetical protein VGG18_03355, partial [Granulicella sp.]
GISFSAASSLQSTIKHSHPVAPDNCNGICSCCAFQGLPNVQQVLIPATATHAAVSPEAPRPAFTPPSAIFRPPRIVVS